MCFTPVIVKRDEVSNAFPCGKCEKCTKKRVSGWSFRLMQQEKKSISAYFLTLTYAPERCHVTQNGFMGLSKRDLQLFFKRLRKAHTTSCDELHKEYPIKYYAVGEYGGKSYRPHYHVIIFNVQLELMIGKKNADFVRRGLIPLDGYHPFQCSQWENGHVTLGEVTAASVGYTMKYITKKKRIPMHRNDDREPEFALMSKRMGREYITDEIISWHKADLLNRMHLTIEDGKKIGMPRYYKELIYTRMERSEIAGYHKGEIEKRVLEETMQIIARDGDLKKHRHNVQEAVKASFNRMHAQSEFGKDKI